MSTTKQTARAQHNHQGQRVRNNSLRLSAMSFAVMFGLWVVLTGSGLWPPIVEPMFLPSPVAVAEAFWQLCVNGYQGNSLWHHFLISFTRFGVAFLLCVLVGVPVGLLMGMYRSVRAILDPPIEITRPIPKLALLPLFIIWFGIGEVSKSILIIASLFPMMTISSMQAVRSVSQRKIQAAQSLGATQFTVFRRVILPASLPGIFTGIRVSIGIGVTMLVAAEMVATSDGIAWMALTAADFMLTSIVLVGVSIMAVLGYTLDRLFRILENRLVHWSGQG